MFNNFFRKILHLQDQLEKYFRTGQATDGSVHAHCMLDI
jgi:hypothetical protein